LPFEQGFEGAAEARPELDLSGDGALDHFTGEAGIEDQTVGQLDWLTHRNRVA
jgi:hypothetical protein